MNLDRLFNIEPYSLDKKDKSDFLNRYLLHLTKHHYSHCENYKNIIDSINFNVSSQHHYTDIPFLPVRLFKIFDLYSVPRSSIIKTMTSSGTSGQALSRIFLDKETSMLQTKSLTKIMSSFIGSHRVPMIILDSPSVLKDRNMFSARGAGILGFSIFARKKIFALDANMNLNMNEIKDFVDEYKDSRILLFGFTFMIYKHFIKELISNNIKFRLPDALLIHGGGWKKLLSEAVSAGEFRTLLKDLCGIESVHDYYGMVEQTGSIFMECEQGYLHASIFSDVIVRRPFDFSPANEGESGLIQTISVLPKSYPGHSLLTEDEGFIVGEDNCKCGRRGKYFKITGRIKNTEIRGCSDTYAEQF